MKKIFDWIGHKFAWLFGIIFVLLLPLFLPFIWIKSIFSNKLSDSEKVGATKEFLSIFFILGLLLAIYLIFGFPSDW